MVIWITGLSGSGKTTLCEAFVNKYKRVLPNLVTLDGDLIRDLYNNDIGYKEIDRIVQINRIQKIAKFLEDQAIIVLVAALYSRQDLLDKNRSLFRNYFEVYLKSDIPFLLQREVKGLYKKALNKEINDVVGVDIPWVEPLNPNLIVDTKKSESPDTLSEKLYNSIKDYNL